MTKLLKHIVIAFECEGDSFVPTRHFLFACDSYKGAQDMMAEKFPDWRVLGEYQTALPTMVYSKDLSDATKRIEVGHWPLYQ